MYIPKFLQYKKIVLVKTKHEINKKKFKYIKKKY